MSAIARFVNIPDCLPSAAFPFWIISGMPVIRPESHSLARYQSLSAVQHPSSTLSAGDPVSCQQLRKLLARWGRLGEHVVQRFGCLGGRLAALDDILGPNRLTIQRFVGIVIAIHRRTFEGHASKQSLRT